jgi:hypothetical protein
MATSSINVYETFTPNVGRTQLASVFPDRAGARRVINDLRAFGLRLDQLSVAMRDPGQQDRLVADTGLHASGGAISPAFAKPEGGLRGLMTDLRSKVLPNNPSLVAERAQSRALPGGMVGAFIHMHMSEQSARRQESSYRAGSVLIMASVFENVAEAQSIMQRHGGGMVNWAKPSTAN